MIMDLWPKKKCLSIFNDVSFSIRSRLFRKAWCTFAYEIYIYRVRMGNQDGVAFIAPCILVILLLLASFYSLVLLSLWKTPNLELPLICCQDPFYRALKRKIQVDVKTFQFLWTLSLIHFIVDCSWLSLLFACFFFSFSCYRGFQLGKWCELSTRDWKCTHSKVTL